MKKLFLTSVALLGCTGMARAYDARVDVSRNAVDANRAYHGDRDDREWDRGDSRSAQDLDRLNHEVREVRLRIGDSHRVPQRIRDRFHRVLRATEDLNAQARRGNIHGGEFHRRADSIRADLDRIRRELRYRSIGLNGFRQGPLA